jgi:uncharacterized protein
MDFEKLIKSCIGFDWNEGNKKKNLIKHGVDINESEQVFTDDPLFFDDEVHSKTENRWGMFGTTENGRKLTIFFTIRSKKIRIISARVQGKNEKLYISKLK